MAVKGRDWSPLDKEVSRRFNVLREQQGSKPLRELAEQAGMTYSRFRDIMVGQNGTPTLTEFIAMCQLFDADPADMLNQARQTVAAQGAARKNAIGNAMAQLQRVTGKDPVQWTTAAYHDSHRDEEQD